MCYNINITLLTEHAVNDLLCKTSMNILLLSGFRCTELINSKTGTSSDMLTIKSM